MFTDASEGEVEKCLSWLTKVEYKMTVLIVHYLQSLQRIVQSVALPRLLGLRTAIVVVDAVEAALDVLCLFDLKIRLTASIDLTSSLFFI